MDESLFAQLVGMTTGLLLLSGVLLVWRRSLNAAWRLLALQGGALAALIVVLAIDEGSLELLGVAVLVLMLKGIALPAVLARTVASDSRQLREESPLINTTSALISVSLLTMLAFLVSQPLAALGESPAVAAVPVGVALVLYGFLLLVSRRHAISQVVGFLVLDNGIAVVAFLTAGGVPLVVELGVSLDVLLIVLILYVLTSRIRSEFGAADLDDLRELRD